MKNYITVKVSGKCIKRPPGKIRSETEKARPGGVISSLQSWNFNRSIARPGNKPEVRKKPKKAFQLIIDQEKAKRKHSHKQHVNRKSYCLLQTDCKV